MTLLAGLLIFTMPSCTTLGQLLPFAIFYGTFSGVWVSILPACLAQLGPTSSVGSRSGLCFAVLSIAGFTGTPIAGAILSSAPDATKWWATMGFSGAVATTGALGLFVSRQVATKGKVWVKF